jgi:hypothetical protein
MQNTIRTSPAQKKPVSAPSQEPVTSPPMSAGIVGIGQHRSIGAALDSGVTDHGTLAVAATLAVATRAMLGQGLLHLVPRDEAA